LALAWSDFCTDWRLTPNNVRGEVYLDDLLVTAGGGPTTTPGTAAAPAEPRPYRLRINTPVDANAFLPDDPLEFTVRLDGAHGPPSPAEGMTLRYRVEDYQRLLIDRGNVPLAPPVSFYGNPAEANSLSLLKTFYLGDRVRREVGRWMAIQVSLEAGGQVLAEGENAFVIAHPRKLTLDEARRSRFFGPYVPGREPLPSGGETHRLTAEEMQGRQGIHGLGNDYAWARRQPTRDSPISFAEDPADKRGPVSQQTFAFEERDPLGLMALHYFRERPDQYRREARLGPTGRVVLCD
jgi:hypothetical protein